MRNVLIILALSITLLAGFLIGCKSDQTNEAQQGEGIVAGTVLDGTTGYAVQGVSVSAQASGGGSQQATTGADGKFSFTFTVDSTMHVVLTFSGTGYRDSTLTTEIRSGSTTMVSMILVSTIPVGPGIITGVVKDVTSGLPLANVPIRALSTLVDPESTSTDATGKYTLTFPVDSSLQQGFAPVDLVIKYAGYRDTTVTTTVKFGLTTSVPVRLVPKSASVISGVVSDATSGKPLYGVSVQAQIVSGGTGTGTATTNVLGEYAVAFQIDSAAIVSLALTKTGYRDTTVYTRVQHSTGVQVGVGMQETVGGATGGTGLAQTIAFLGATPPEISVYGVGGKETSLLEWEVRDSLGIPIDGAHAVVLAFTIVNGPGGEYVSPANMTTSDIGKALTTLNAGTKAGVVQVVASAVVGTRTITSSPVRVTINGGFPDQVHFTIAPKQYNFPAWNWLDRRDQVSVLLGDKYSNPVAPNTAVYFRSSAGVIQPSVFTNRDGEGTVDLISGNPRPFGPFAAASPLDTAYHYVVARTVGEGGVTVQDSILLLWSGVSMISNVTPTSFDIPNGGDTTFTFTVSDQFHHPLSPGTNVSVSAQVPPPPDPNTPVNQVQVGFGRNGTITFDDYIFRGPGTTEFTFRLSDGTANITQTTAVVVTIAVTSSNGNTTAVIYGTVH